MESMIEKGWMQARRPLKTALGLGLLCFVLLTPSCMEKKKGKTIPFFPQQVTPYTPAELGITAPPANSPLAVLPVISDTERDKIAQTFEDMDKMGMLTEEYWSEASISARRTMEFVPVSDAQLDAQIDAAFTGASYTPPATPSKEFLLEKNGLVADHFYAEIAGHFSEMSDQEVIALRHQQTLALVINRMSQDHRDSAKGIPIEFIELSRRKIAAFRDQVNAELVRRGVTDI